MYQALYRKYRPQTFDDVVGQLAVTQTLKNQVAGGRLSHAYLFTGSRGTGKTSSAKILAKAVNCENPQDGNPCNCCAACRAIDAGTCMDVLEIDAASNNGVDNVRDLRDDAIYTPSQVKMRVYIIDEVHMLSISAFNALLKIIEEPPEHLLFILATTELHKVPATILSRCQRFSFRRISQEDIAARLQYVAYQENIDLDNSAANILARLADGGMRDGLSLLDQCASATTGELNADRVYACLGIAGTQQCGKLMAYIAEHNTAAALSLLNSLYADGKDMAALLDEMACLVRDLMILQTAPKEGITMLSGVTTDKEAMALSSRFSGGELIRILNLIQQTQFGFSRSGSRRLDTETCFINLCEPELVLDPDALNARLTRIEDQLRSGNISVNVQPLKNEQPSSEQAEQERSALPEEPQMPVFEEDEDVPAGFWMEISAQLRKELKPPAVGFFSGTPSAPVKGVVQKDRFVLVCDTKFVFDLVNKPEILQLVGLKVSAKLGRKMNVIAVDKNTAPAKSEQMEQLLAFGRAHSDKIMIKE